MTTKTRLLRRATLAVAMSLLFASTVQAGADAPLPKDLPPYAPDKPLPVQEPGLGRHVLTPVSRRARPASPPACGRSRCGWRW